MDGVQLPIASRSELIPLFTGLTVAQFERLVEAVAERGGDAVADGRPGRPWSLPLPDRVLLVAVYYRTNLTMRQLAPLFGVKQAAVHRIVDRLGPHLALESTPAPPGGSAHRGRHPGPHPGPGGRGVEQELPELDQPAGSGARRFPAGARASGIPSRATATTAPPTGTRGSTRRRARRLWSPTAAIRAPGC